MQEYYAKRALEYEDIYHRQDQERQAEQTFIAQAIQRSLAGRTVLEVACGTGYWTQFLSETATRIVATDITKEVLHIARSKTYKCPVSFQRHDAYNLGISSGLFIDGGLANLWFSHVPKAQIGSFLEEFHRTLRSGAIVFMADNVYVDGVGGDLVTIPGDENTYKDRTLKDGTKSLILKNYYQPEALTTLFQEYDPNFSLIDVNYGKCFWWLAYQPAHL